MSQEKVNKYKESKANRKEIVKKEKRNKVVGRIIGSVVAVVVVAWIVVSAVFSINNAINSKQIPVDLSAVSEYMTELSGETETEEHDHDHE